MMISRLTLADERAYINFLQKAYKGQFNGYRYARYQDIKDFWRWEYMDNPYNKTGEPLVWVCRSGGNIVGQLCVMPVIISVSGKDYRGGWCQDFMVLPEFRAKGIGQQLVHEVQKGLIGITDITMAVIATDRSRALFRKQGFVEMGRISKNIALSMVPRILLSFKKAGRKKDVVVKEIEPSSVQFDSLWKDLSGRFGCMAKRNKEMTEWRFRSQSYWTYKVFMAKEDSVPKGYIAVKEKKAEGAGGWNAGIISDIFFEPSEIRVGKALILKAMDTTKKGMPVIRCDAMGVSLQSFLKSIGFIEIRSDNVFLICVSDKLSKEDSDIVCDMRNWYITYGDSDLDLS